MVLFSESSLAVFIRSFQHGFVITRSTNYFVLLLLVNRIKYIIWPNADRSNDSRVERVLDKQTWFNYRNFMNISAAIVYTLYDVNDKASQRRIFAIHKCKEIILTDSINLNHNIHPAFHPFYFI